MEIPTQGASARSPQEIMTQTQGKSMMVQLLIIKITIRIDK